MLIQDLGILLGCLFFHSRNDGNEPTRNSFDKYYMLLVEIKDFNLLKKEQFRIYVDPTFRNIIRLFVFSIKK